MEFRKRFLVVLMAVSLLVVYDVFANGAFVVSQLAESMIRTSSEVTGPRISDQAPFLAKQGRFAEPLGGARRVVVRGVEDIQVVRGTGDQVAMEYVVRTYAVSQNRAREYHEQANVRFVRAGDAIEIVFEGPAKGRDLLGFRTSYLMRVPDGVALELEDISGSADLHGLTGNVVVRRPAGAVTVMEHVGAVRVEASEGSTWLAGVRGEVEIHHRRGLVELVDIDGRVTVGGERTSVIAEAIRGDMTATVDRGVGIFYAIEGDLKAVANMAHVTVDGVGGSLELVATKSPVELGASLGPTSLDSEGAHVRLSVAGSGPRSLDVRVENGAIITDLPLEVAREGRSASRLSGTLGSGGGAPLLVRAVGGDVMIDSL